MPYNKPTANQISLGSSTMLDDVINPAGNWIGSPTGLQGSTGAQGVNGSNGAQGATGAQGFNGSNGAQGATGLQGITGSQGANGAQGVQGRQGTTGTGNTGSQGANGANGAQGTSGTNGAQGTSGTNGSQGTSGTNGAQGATGTQGATGSGGLTGSGTNTYLAKWSSGSNLSTGSAYESGGTVYSTDFSASSDARLKNIIGFVDDALFKISQLNAVRYSWNMTARDLGYENRDYPEIGVLAQEVQAILPEIVTVDDKGYLRVSYDRLVPVLIEAVKEGRVLNKQLEERVAKLEQVLLGKFDHT